MPMVASIRVIPDPMCSTTTSDVVVDEEAGDPGVVRTLAALVVGDVPPDGDDVPVRDPAVGRRHDGYLTGAPPPRGDLSLVIDGKHN
jgi:hypothetical protein